MSSAFLLMERMTSPSLEKYLSYFKALPHFYHKSLNCIYCWKGSEKKKKKSNFKGLLKRMIAALYSLEPKGNWEKVVDTQQDVGRDPEGTLFSYEGKCYMLFFLNHGNLQNPSFLPKLQPPCIFSAKTAYLWKILIICFKLL